MKYLLLVLLTGCTTADFEYERACSYDHINQRQKTVEVVEGGVSRCVVVERNT